jgi:hypothetical protein
MSLRVGLVSVLLVGATAFGAGHGKGGHHVDVDGDYTGHGGWKSTDGTKGKFEMTTTIKTDKTSITVKDSVTIHIPGAADKKMDEEIVLTNMKNGFFEVQEKGVKVGNGYCGVKQCHSQTAKADSTSEETVTFHKGKLYRIGSHTMKDMVVAWQGVMNKKGTIRPK